MIRHWVRHLALHVALGRVTTVVVSKKGVIELPPRDPAEARERLHEIIDAWHEGMRRPLPLAPKAAFAWLRAYRDPAADHDKAYEAARSTYEGGYKRDGECRESAYLSRAWPSFDALWAGCEPPKLASLASPQGDEPPLGRPGGRPEFRELAERLLRPLQDAIPTKHAKKSGQGPAK